MSGSDMGLLVKGFPLFCLKEDYERQNIPIGQKMVDNFGDGVTIHAVQYQAPNEWQRPSGAWHSC